MSSPLLQVLDTCGMFDTKRPHKEVEQEIRKSHLMIAPGPHAFLLVVPVEQFTEEHQKSVKRLEHIFPNLYQFTVIIFSKAYQLARDGHTENFEDVLAKSEELKTLCSKVSNRYVLFDCAQSHKAMLERRVYQVLDQVCCLYDDNHCRHYRSDMFTQAETIAASMDEEIVREASTVIKSENEARGGYAVLQRLVEMLPSNMKVDFNAEGPDKQPKEGSEDPDRQLEEDREDPDRQLEEDREDPDRQLEEDREDPDRQLEEDREDPDRQLEEDREDPDTQLEEDKEDPDTQLEEDKEDPDKGLEEDKEDLDKEVKEQLLGRLVLISDVGLLNRSSGRLAPEFRLPDTE